MARKLKSVLWDMYHTSAVEQRVKDYKRLVIQLEQAIYQIKEAITYMDAVKMDLNGMADTEHDGSDGPLVLQFEEISEGVQESYLNIYRYMNEEYELLQTRKNQAETQLAYYQQRKRYEDTLDRELLSYEYNYN